MVSPSHFLGLLDKTVVIRVVYLRKVGVVGNMHVLDFTAGSEQGTQCFVGGGGLALEVGHFSQGAVHVEQHLDLGRLFICGWVGRYLETGVFF